MSTPWDGGLAIISVFLTLKVHYFLFHPVDIAIIKPRLDDVSYFSLFT